MKQIKAKSEAMYHLYQSVQECEFGLYIRYTEYHKLLFHRDIQIPDKPE